MGRRTDIDWAAIKIAHADPNQSVRSIAKRHNITEATIRQRAATEGWPARTTQTSAQVLDAVGEEVIEARIADCETLSVIAASYGVSNTSLHDWLDSHPELYTRARERQADKLAADILEIADAAERDTITDDDGNVRTDHEVVARSRLRVDARKWLAAKMRPRVYGEKLDLTAAVTVRDMTDDQLRARAAELMAKLGFSQAKAD